jgi:hypothetical protein
LRGPATACAILRLEAEMRRQVLARHLQTKPLRAVLGWRDECHGSYGIEQDDIASSDIYDSVVVNDDRFAGILICDLTVLLLIAANVQFRPLHAGCVLVRPTAANPKTRCVRTLLTKMFGEQE